MTEYVPPLNAVDPAVAPTTTLRFPLPFWKRMAAYALDMIALGMLFEAIGIFAKPLYAALGPWGHVVGGVAGVVYFGYCGSSLAAGQTLGKRIAGIAVRRRQGGNLTPGASFLRATVVMLPMTANGLALGTGTTVVPIIETIVVFGLGGVVVYLFLFNIQTRQSVHDLAVGSVVVDIHERPEDVDGTVSRRHFAIMGGLFVAAVALSVIASREIGMAVKLDDLEAARRRIASMADTDNVQVLDATTAGTGGGATWLEASVMTYVPPADQERLAREIGRLLLRVPRAATRDRIVVTISSGYDVLFATSSHTTRWDYTRLQWRERVGN